MKTLCFNIFFGILIIVSCSTDEIQNSESADFEIYETISQNKLPAGVIEKLRQKNIKFDTDILSPIIGFIHKEDSVDFSEIGNDGFKLLTTVYPIDKEKMYFALVAVKNHSVLNNSDIKKTKPSQNNVEIFFNLEGAKKWANLTNNCNGKLIAFTIDNKIYTLTTVNGEIRCGVAVINGLESENMAKEISKSINSN